MNANTVSLAPKDGSDLFTITERYFYPTTHAFNEAARRLVY